MLPDDHFHTSIFQLPVTYTYNYNDSKNDNGEGDDHTLLRAQQQQQQQQYQPSTSIKQLELEWTDFSSMAIDKLISMVPTLTHVSFGANHNRLKNANTTALESLKRHCPLIESLKIALQQIHPPILSHIIIYYGPRQLYHLDIQCHHIDTLKTVAQYANKVKQLVIHSVGQQEVDIKDPLVVANKVMSIVQQCNQLIHMEMISWGIKDIPSVILYAHQRRSNTWLEKASLVLNNELLAEVRNLFIS
ncbi:hypothetical protein BC941DRAFT_452458 [Chlamydoabsidia padenii]|nr:hypothetical protein BC941DRAFT_452458 [Chlamydoabsidia padenii]